MANEQVFIKLLGLLILIKSNYLTYSLKSVCH